MEKISVEVMLDPKKHGYTECAHCNGYGSSFKDAGDGRCSKCGGSGLVRKENHGGNNTTTAR